MPHYIYIVRCADRSLYTGTAKDLSKRIDVHNQGKGARYTRARLPVTLLYSEERRTLIAARKRERQIKKLSRAEKVELIGRTHRKKVK